MPNSERQRGTERGREIERQTGRHSQNPRDREERKREIGNKTKIDTRFNPETESEGENSYRVRTESH